jgi:hypothetical protein
MATLDITKIPAPRVALIDENTGLMSREWYRFFYNLFVLAGSGGNQITLDDLQVGPPSQQDFTEILRQVNTNIAPQYEDQSGDFLKTLDTAQLMSMMARFENVEAAIQGAYLNPPSIPTDGVYVPYTNATANVDLNAKTLTNVSHVGINTTTVPTTLLRAFGDNNTSSRISVRGYSSDANSSSMRVTKFRGTYAAPQAPFSGDSLGKFELAGYGTTSSDGYAQASFEGVATENWGATARGSKTLIKVTPNTTTTQVTAVTIDQDKSVTFATTASATTFIGALTGIASGNVLSVSGTAPVVSSGGTTPAISMPKATTSVDGYLSSTDWTTFNSKGSGTVTTVSVVSANGLAGTVATATTTPAITLSTTITGLLKGNGTAISAATSGTDYAPATSGTSILYGNGSGGFSNVTIGTGVSFVTGTLSATGSGGTVTSVTGTAPVVSSGGNTPAISMAAASASVDGYLTKTDWSTFNSKGSGTVTSVAALTLGTTGTDLTSTVATGTTTPVITLNVPTASASNRGALSAADWTTFNGKGSGSVTSVAQSFTGGLISVAGSPITTSGTLALTVAGTSGGIPYFSSASTWASSAALTASALVIGGGAGAAPATTTTGTGVVTALGVNTGTAGAFVVNGGALGTPSSGTVTNLTGTASINTNGAHNGTVGATTPNTGAFTVLTETTGAAWTAYTPTVSTNTGSFGALTVIAARYRLLGKTLFLSLSAYATVASGLPTQFRLSLPTGTIGFSSYASAYGLNNSVVDEIWLMSAVGTLSFVLFTRPASAAMSGLCQVFWTGIVELA